MYKIIKFSFFILLFFTSISSKAFYISTNFNVSGFASASTDESIDSSIGGFHSFGFKLSKQLDFELGFVHNVIEKKENKIDYVALNINSLTNIKADTKGGFSGAIASLYFNLPTQSKLKPFIGFGLGAGEIEYTITNIQSLVNIDPIYEKETNLMIHFSTGVRVELFKNLSAQIKYDMFKSSFLDTAKQYGILSDYMINAGISVLF